jgi:hypothetical protein
MNFRQAQICRYQARLAGHRAVHPNFLPVVVKPWWSLTPREERADPVSAARDVAAQIFQCLNSLFHSATTAIISLENEEQTRSVSGATLTGGLGLCTFGTEVRYKEQSQTP